VKARVFDQALLGLRQLLEAEIVHKAGEAAKSMFLLQNDGRF
jgi:hypothetical protein